MVLKLSSSTFSTPITRVIPEPSPVWSSHCQLLREFHKILWSWALNPPMMPNYIIPTFSENDPNLVSWHLTYVDMTRISHFLKLDKIKSVNKAAMNEIAQLYIFSCFLIIQQRYWYRPQNGGHPAGPKTGTDLWARHVMSLQSGRVSKTIVRLLK